MFVIAINQWISFAKNEKRSSCGYWSQTFSRKCYLNFWGVLFAAARTFEYFPNLKSRSPCCIYWFWTRSTYFDLDKISDPKYNNMWTEFRTFVGICWQKISSCLNWIRFTCRTRKFDTKHLRKFPIFFEIYLIFLWMPFISRFHWWI